MEQSDILYTVLYCRHLLNTHRGKSDNLIRASVFHRKHPERLPPWTMGNRCLLVPDNHLQYHKRCLYTDKYRRLYRSHPDCATAHRKTHQNKDSLKTAGIDLTFPYPMQCCCWALYRLIYQIWSVVCRLLSAVLPPAVFSAALTCYLHLSWCWEHRSIRRHNQQA